MLVTRRYYNQRQIVALGACAAIAAIIGSLQTAYIVMKCKNKAQL